MSRHPSTPFLLAACTVGFVLGCTVTYDNGTQVLEASATGAQDPEKTRLPNGRVLSKIDNGVYPSSYMPNTEQLGPDEMRVTALGTGMPQVIQKKTKAAGFYVELGNGDKFIFDLGTGSTENLAALRPDYSQLRTVFLSHLHSDHAGDFAPLYIGGWMNGRYEPLHIYGPSGSKPELGTKAFVDNQIKAWAWDIEGRKGTFPDNGGKAIAHEFDYKKEQVVYEKNGVTVQCWPAIHALDGSVSYRMDWGKRSFVFGGDTAPNKWFMEHAKGAELVIHECFLPAEALAVAMDINMRQATYITNYVHTPPTGFGKVMSALKPRMAVGYHIWGNKDLLTATEEGVRKTYDGPYVQATDFTVFNVTDKQVVVREAVTDDYVLPTGTTKAYLTAFRSKVDENTKISQFLAQGRWKGFTPAPLPQDR